MLKFSAALLAASLISSTAFAADFTGPRIEVRGGWDRTGAKLKYSDSAFPDDDFTAKENTTGVSYGVGIGYDFALGETLVGGVFAGVDLSDNKKCDEVFGDDAACFKTRRDFEVGGRLGQVFSNKAMFYVSAAYVNGGGKISYTDDLDPTNDFALKDNKGGYRLGLGLEAMFGQYVYGKLEYRYSNYSNFKASAGTERVSLGFDRNQVVAGVGVRF